MDKKILSIKEKLNLLRRKDTAFAVFGAQRHRYQLNPVLSETEISNFEKSRKLRLPEEYRNFLLYIGDGIAGPFYGLEKLEDSLFADLDYRDKGDLVDPSKPFPYTAAWNLDFSRMSEEAYELAQEDYFDRKHASGLLRLSNYGCGISVNLVVNGAAYGQIWMDDRCNDQGFYPDHYFGNEAPIDFLNWYELWLDDALKSI